MYEKPMTKRQLKSLKTKKKIYKTNLELCNKYGYDNVTIADICKAAGVSVGSFYNLFDSKDSLWLFYSDVEESKIENVIHNLSEGTCSDRLKLLFIKKLELALKVSPDVARACRIAYLNGCVFDAHSPERLWFKSILKEIKCGQDTGEFRDDVDPKQIANMLLYASDSLNAIWCLSNGKEDAFNMGKNFYDTLMTMLKK